MFDLPTKTQNDKAIYRQFRKFLINEGFLMHQYSIYSKIFLNNTNKDMLINRLKKNTPKNGLVTILSITEKQFSGIIYLTGDKDESIANTDSRVIFLGE